MVDNEQKELLDALVRIEKQLESLYEFQKKQPVRKLIFKWLVALYPAIICVLLLAIDVDHRKFMEVLSDTTELVADINAILYPDQADN